MTAVTPKQVLSYWFGDQHDWVAVARDNSARWFEHGKSLDGEIRDRFGDAVAAARRNELDHWADAPRSCLGLVLLLDQFPRHIFRGTAEAFASDTKALAVCRAGVERGLDSELSAVEQMFFYLPLQHAEDAAAQDQSVALLRRCVETCPQDLREFAANSLRYAEQHRDIVQQFGRFPHRNELLGRTHSDAEQAYLDSGGSRFGQ